MIIFVKTQKQNIPKNPTLKSETRAPQTRRFLSEQPAEGAHAPTRAGSGQPPPKLTKPDQNLNTGWGEKKSSYQWH